MNDDMDDDPGQLDRLSASLKRIYPPGDLPTLTIRKRRRSRPLAAVLAAACALALAVSIVAIRSNTRRHASDADGPRYLLATNDWQPGEPGLLAADVGEFHAARGSTPGVVCAWLGSADEVVPTLWPKGWRVTLDPVQLIQPDGEVFATEGDVLTSSSGVVSDKSEVPGCGAVDSPTTSLFQIKHAQ